MHGCTSPGHAQRFLSAYGPIAPHCRPRRHLWSASGSREERRTIARAGPTSRGQSGLPRSKDDLRGGPLVFWVSLPHQRDNAPPCKSVGASSKGPYTTEGKAIANLRRDDSHSFERSSSRFADRSAVTHGSARRQGACFSCPVYFAHHRAGFGVGGASRGGQIHRLLSLVPSDGALRKKFTH